MIETSAIDRCRGSLLALIGTRWRSEADERGVGPVDHGAEGQSALGSVRKRSASGQAAAKAKRTRLAVSMMRAAIFSRRSRKVANPTAGEVARPGDGIAHGERQPGGGGVQHEPRLIGQRRAARGPVRGELRLVQLDQVLGLAAGAIGAVIEPFRRAEAPIGDDEADEQPKPDRGLRERALTRQNVGHRAEQLMVWRRTPVGRAPEPATVKIQEAARAAGLGHAGGDGGESRAAVPLRDGDRGMVRDALPGE